MEGDMSVKKEGDENRREFKVDEVFRSFVMAWTESLPR